MITDTPITTHRSGHMQWMQIKVIDIEYEELQYHYKAQAVSLPVQVTVTNTTTECCTVDIHCSSIIQAGHPRCKVVPLHHHPWMVVEIRSLACSIMV